MTLLNECLMEETYKNPQGVKHVKLDVLTMGFLSVGEGGEAWNAERKGKTVVGQWREYIRPTTTLIECWLNRLYNSTIYTDR